MMILLFERAGEPNQTNNARFTPGGYSYTANDNRGDLCFEQELLKVLDRSKEIVHQVGINRLTGAGELEAQPGLCGDPL
jgi:hypothetical protein